MLHDAVTALRTRCESAGLDIVHPLRLDWFNDGVEPSLRLPDGGRARALALVIGNTRALWPAFLAAMQSDEALRDVEHPLDTYVERALTDAARQSIADSHVILWAHRMMPAPIAIQRVAHASGLAYLSPSHLSVHPVYGPWLALRAVIVVDADGPAGERPEPHDPCTRCAKPCMPALERATAASSPTDAQAAIGGPRAIRSDEVERQWALWANVREVCPEGRHHRYGDDQLRYHYTKDRSLLRQVLR
jgi:methylmalonic aciduria homocystinuria type C protein